MGVGNWSVRSRHFTTDVIHVDSLRETFEEYRARANEHLLAYLEVNHPQLMQDSSEVTLDSLVEDGLTVVAEEACDNGGFVYWDNEEGFLSDESRRRYREFVQGMREASGAVPGAFTDPAQLERARFDDDSDATVLAVGKRAQVVLREWETQLYVGIAPKNDLDNEEDFIVKDHLQGVMRFVGACWAACDPRNDRFKRYGKPDRLSDYITIRPHEVDVLYDGDVDARLLERVAQEAVQAAAAVLERGQAAEIAAFTQAFGVSPTEVEADAQGNLEEDVDFVARFKATPEVIQEEYREEFGAFQRAVLDAMAMMGEEPYRASTAWTSSPVDLSPYRQVLVAQLGESDVAALLEGASLHVALHGRSPCSISIMRESVFDRTVIGAVQHRYPHEVEVAAGTLYMSNPSKTSEGGVLVWRGHESWRGNDEERELSAWLKERGGAPLRELPGWMTLILDSQELRATIDSLGAPQAIHKSFFEEDGELAVTGVLAETRDGDYGSVYVTTYRRPFDLDAMYEAVLVNEQWRPVSDTTQAATAAPGANP